MKAPGYLNLLGDFIHNLMDGLALGIAFHDGEQSLIISTLVAIIAHEVP